MTIMDVHTHYVPNAYLEWMRRSGEAHGRRLVARDNGRLAILADAREIPLPALFYDVQARLDHMSKRCVDCHVVAPPPFLLHYDLPAEIGEELCRLLNDEALTLSERHAGKFVPMGVLPLQDIPRAIGELERIMRLGFRSVEIGASINDKELDDPALDPFWDATERYDVLVFIHPVRPPGRDRMNDYHLFNLIGFLAETTLACGRLIFSGTLDRYPDVKVCLSHAGGMLPWIIGRFDHGFDSIDACSRNIGRPPSSYLPRFYYDTITHGAGQLKFLIEMVGAERVMMGSDFPFRIGDEDPVRRLQAAGLRARDLDLILRENAGRLLFPSQLS